MMDISYHSVAPQIKYTPIFDNYKSTIHLWVYSYPTGNANESQIIVICQFCL